MRFGRSPIAESAVSPGEQLGCGANRTGVLDSGFPGLPLS